MDEIEIKQKPRKEIKAFIGDEVIEKCLEMSLKVELPRDKTE